MTTIVAKMEPSGDLNVGPVVVASVRHTKEQNARYFATNAEVLLGGACL